MSRFLVPCAAMLACVLTLAANGQIRRGKQPHVVAIWEVPIEIRGRQNPYNGQPDAVLAGKKLFHQHCAQCHGDDGRGIDKPLTCGLRLCKAPHPAIWNGSCAMEICGMGCRRGLDCRRSAAGSSSRT